jgi:hypothetical protein
MEIGAGILKDMCMSREPVIGLNPDKVRLMCLEVGSHLLMESHGRKVTGRRKDDVTITEGDNCIYLT